MTMNVGASNTINVQLEEDAEALEEVVVVGYGSRSKELSTSATVANTSFSAFS